VSSVSGDVLLTDLVSGPTNPVDTFFGVVAVDVRVDVFGGR
jgi:hypothetical protein